MTESGPRTYLGRISFEAGAAARKLNLKVTNADISGGVIPFLSSYMVIDTEGDAGSDNLDTIDGGEIGDILILQTENSSRDVTLRHGVGNIWLAGGSNKTLIYVRNKIVLIKASENDWHQFAIAL